MEKLNFFFVKRRYISFLALKDYICEDLIIKIIENNMGDKKMICNLDNIHTELKKYQVYEGNTQWDPFANPIPLSLLFLNELFRNQNYHIYIDLSRKIYLKDKMSEKKDDYYSKRYKTWIKFQYYLNNTMFFFQSSNTYGFKNNKKFSYLLNKD